MQRYTVTGGWTIAGVPPGGVLNEAVLPHGTNIPVLVAAGHLTPVEEPTAKTLAAAEEAAPPTKPRRARTTGEA